MRKASTEGKAQQHKCTILVTGFEPFDEVKDNPSQRIVEHLVAQQQRQNNESSSSSSVGDNRIIAKVLPVDYIRVMGELIPFIEKHQPDAIILLGVAQKRTEISLESFALNINDASIPDNDGNFKKGQEIVPKGPVAYRSTLPLEDMWEAMTTEKIPVEFSNHAGAYLCNHVMYSSLHYLASVAVRRDDIPCGFIHVPNVTAVPLGQQIQAIEQCIDVLVKQLKKIEDTIGNSSNFRS